MSEQLKPCPFCGSEGKVFFNDEACYHGGKGTYYIVCAECASRGKNGNDEQQAIEAWNRRVGDDK